MRSTFFLFALALLSSAGCLNCCHKAGELALRPESCPEAPADQRSRVYAIVVRGFDPLCITGADKLREELNRRGFAKVYCVDFYHAAFIEKEVQRIRCEDPDARFVVVGNGLGAGVAQSLTTRLSQAGAPIDALVEVTPVYLPLTTVGQDLSGAKRHVILTSKCGATEGYGPGAEVMQVDGTNYFTITGSYHTVSLIRDILLEATGRVPPAAENFPTLPLLDNPAPLPGEILIAPHGI